MAEFAKSPLRKRVVVGWRQVLRSRTEIRTEQRVARALRGRPMTNAELVDSLCQVSIPLRESRRVHIKAYGTLIPHVFMGDVLKRIGVCLLAGAKNALASHGPEMHGILKALEHGIAEGDRETRNVIAISFARDSEVELFFDELLPLLGPRTRAQLEGQ